MVLSSEVRGRRPRQETSQGARSLWAVVLAGGEGVRLRPLVRRAFGDERPKQFCPLLGPRTLLRQTLDRVGLLIPHSRTVVVGLESHARYLAREFDERPGPHVLSQPLGARPIAAEVSAGGSPHVARTLLCLLIIVIAGFSAGCRGSSTASGAPLPPVVKVEPVVEKDVPIYGEWVGTTVGYVTAQISARVSGYLVSQNYREGTRVKAGDLLFEIDPRQYQIAVEQARAQLLQTESQLEQAKAQVAQAEADVARAEANQKKTELDVGRYTCPSPKLRPAPSD